jgi:plasmid rolling circle replication initiator protein Rep
LEVEYVGSHVSFTKETVDVAGDFKIDDVQLQNSGKTSRSAALFSGNFPYEITGDTSSEQLQHLHELIDNWQYDFKTYRKLVNQRFLEKMDSEKLQGN